MPLLRVVAFASALALSGCSEKNFQAVDLDPYSILPGQWGWQGSDDCAVSPEVIRFSSDSKQVFFAHAPIRDDRMREERREVRYQILDRRPYGLNMLLDDEKRLDPSGKPVTWDIVLISQDEICWHRNDWRTGGCTKHILRCKI